MQHSKRNSGMTTRLYCNNSTLLIAQMHSNRTKHCLKKIIVLSERRDVISVLISQQSIWESTWEHTSIKTHIKESLSIVCIMLLYAYMQQYQLYY